MPEFDGDHILSQKERVVDAVEDLVGFEPPGLRALLRTLSHPAVVHEVAEYFAAQDVKLKCLLYEYPWSCSKQAEAMYENIKYGWLAGATGIAFDESWCDNCKKRVLGE